MKTSSLSALFCLTAVMALAGPPTAEQVLTEAKARASAENKAIFVHFTASWCAWCKRLDALLQRPEMKPVFEKHFVPISLDIQEEGKNRALENAGASKVFKKAGGSDSAGLPFFAFLDKDGKLIVNSMRPSGKGNENIAYPGEPERAEWFLTMIKKAAPQITAAELKQIEGALNAERK